MLIRIGNCSLQRTFSTVTRQCYVAKLDPSSTRKRVFVLLRRALTETEAESPADGLMQAAPLLDAGIMLCHYTVYCPVQADGRFDRVPFYFRARWSHWHCEVGHGVNDEDNWPENPWVTGGDYGHGDCGASWMSEADAYHFINRSYRKWKIHQLSMGEENL